jgi:hypothetical protein
MGILRLKECVRAGVVDDILRDAVGLNETSGDASRVHVPPHGLCCTPDLMGWRHFVGVVLQQDAVVQSEGSLSVHDASVPRTISGLSFMCGA